MGGDTRKIKNKQAGEDVLFRLYYPQRILVSRFEECRRNGKPIRLILLKARQWGGSTTTQLYMAWLQFFHRKGLNSLIIAHQGTASDEIKDMFDRMVKDYPVEFLHDMGEEYAVDEPKLVGVGKSGSTHRVPQRNCKIKIGTAERPDGCRGGDYSLVHLSEVGLWRKTDGKSPEDIVRAACSGILLQPLTMIVMESTANGTGNFFHREYRAAADPKVKSQYQALFIAWFQIEQYRIPFASDDERRRFARCLYTNRENNNIPSAREECGKYLWWLWTKGASLEAIHWYIEERAGKTTTVSWLRNIPLTMRRLLSTRELWSSISTSCGNSSEAADLRASSEMWPRTLTRAKRRWTDYTSPKILKDRYGCGLSRSTTPNAKSRTGT